MARFSTGNRGFVLIAVLWVTAFLAAALAALTRSANTDVRIASNAIGLAEAEALADAGVQLAIRSLMRHTADRAGSLRLERLAPETVTCTLGEGTIGFEHRRAAGRVDLNRAPAGLLAVLLAGHGLPAEEAVTLAARIADWRDGDDVPGERGAEREAYLAAGRPDEPRNAPFDTVEELDRVLGFTVELVNRIAGDLTTESRQEQVDPSAAQPALVARLREGASRLSGSVGELGAMLKGSSSPIFIVTGAGLARQGARAGREAVVEINPRTRSYQVRSYRTVVPGPLSVSSRGC